MYKASKPLKHPENSEHGFNYALFVLNLSMQTEAEMRTKMIRRGYMAEVVDEVVARLKDFNYLNDNQYADSFINSMKSYKTYGYHTIRQKMFLKKLPAQLVEQKLAEHFSESEEKEVLARYLTKELKLPHSVSAQEVLAELKALPYEQKQKYIRKAGARGFRLNVILD